MHSDNNGKRRGRFRAFVSIYAVIRRKISTIASIFDNKPAEVDSPSDAQPRARFLPSPAESKRVQSNLAHLGIIGSESKLHRRPSEAEDLPLIKDQPHK